MLANNSDLYGILVLGHTGIHKVHIDSTFTFESSNKIFNRKPLKRRVELHWWGTVLREPGQIGRSFYWDS